MSIIQTVALTKKFGDFVANSSIDLSVEKGEIRCIVGENGAGKSTLMNMLYGLLEPTSGKILIRDEEVRLRSPVDAIAHGLGMVHQHFKLVSSLTVFENVLLGAEILRPGLLPLIDRRREVERVRELIERYRFDLDPEDRIEDISVGSCQRVEILKMLYRNVDVLILDEPTAVLTPQEVDDLLQSLRELRDAGKTIIMITHKLREVMEVSDSITVIRRGEVIDDVRTADTNEAELAKMMVGREVAHAVNDASTPVPGSELTYRASGLTTTNAYGKQVLSDVSFDVRAGEVLGVAGVEGNGQSELVKLVCGMMEPTAGSMSLLAEDVTGKWPDELRRRGMAIVPEDRYAQGLCATMSVADNTIAGYQGAPDVCHGGLLDYRAIRAKRDRFIEDYAIRVGDVDGDVGALSGGNAQKVIVARELGSSPRFLVACQPTRGVDIGSAEFIHGKILEFRNAGNAVLLVSSELSEVMSLADRVIVMYKGQVVGEVDPKTTTNEQIGLLMAGIREGGE